MIKRLRIKFVCINMILVTVMLLLILGLQYHTTRVGLDAASLGVLQNAALEPDRPGRPGFPDKNASQPCFTLQLDQLGNLIAIGEFYDLTDEETLGQILSAAMAAEEETGVLEQYALRFLRSDTPLGIRFIFTDVSADDQTLDRMLYSCIAIGAAGFLAFLGISILLARWAVKPVEKAWQQQRQFVADASHELKTPLTVILTNAELLQEPSYGEEERQRFSDSILTMSRQMRGLVESLLELARVDNGRVRTMMGTVDFSKVVSDGVLPFEPIYFEQGLTLDSQVEPGISLVGSEQHLWQLVEVLLDNGQKYSAPGGCVYLRLTRHSHNQCLLAVASPGAALTAQQCKDIFKRFYRVDQARGMNQSYGLGLSIAQQIVADHGGKIWAVSKDGWNTFFVTLPIRK